MSLVRVSTKKIIVMNVPKSTIDVQYPHTWFEANPGLKPPVPIELVTDDIKIARGMIKKAILDNKIDIKIACTFLYLYGSTINDTLNEDWSSYQVSIGRSGEEITPISIIDPKIKLVKRDFPGVDKVSSKHDAWMAGAVLGIYRLIRTTASDYKTSLVTRINAQLLSLCKDSGGISDKVDIYLGWQNNRTFNALVACYDMFFNKFPIHPLAKLRISTTGTRHRDCAALMSYGYITSLLGMSKLTDLKDWVFIEQIGRDIDRMTSNDELLEDFSYFPYHVDLGLVRKSAYSASANPHFFEWVHLVGAMMRSKRSCNARHLKQARAGDIFANSACLAYVYANVVPLNKVTADGESHTVSHNQDKFEEALRSKDPVDWIFIIRSSKGELPKKVKGFIESIVKKIHDPKEGTIDHYLKSVAPIYTSRN